LQDEKATEVLVLSGDQLYRFDFRELLQRTATTMPT